MIIRLDLNATSYQKANKLTRKLERDAEKLKNFEKKYFKGKDSFTWAGQTLNRSDYDSKALEIIIPDTIVSEQTLNALNDFKKSCYSEYGIEVWYRIGE